MCARLESPESADQTPLFRGVPDLPCVLQFDNAALQANRNCVRPVVGSKFGEDVLDVALDRFLGDRELGRDLLVRITAGDQSEDVDFPRG